MRLLKDTTIPAVEVRLNTDTIFYFRHNGFVGEVNNKTLGFREHFRANLRKSLYEHLGKQYHETKRHAEKLHTNMDGTGQLDQLRQWLYQDPNIHEKVDFSDGTYKQTKIGVEGLKGGLVGAEARTLPEI